MLFTSDFIQIDNIVFRSLLGRSRSKPFFRAENRKQEVIKNYEQSENVKVELCGLFLNENYPYLEASPDGLLPNNGIFKIVKEKNVYYKITGEKIC